MKKLISIISVFLLLLNSYFVVGLSIDDYEIENFEIQDYDPLVDINITVKITAIRALDKIDCGSKPDFFVKLKINNEEFTSPTWMNSKQVYPDWSVTTDVPDDIKNISINIQLWDYNEDGDIICDIGNEGFDIDIEYDISTGRWSGDDYHVSDGSGYGRVCGTNDGSIYEDQNDCELWFDIFQNDYDSDNIPYWTETEVYGTDPEVDDTGSDVDEDKIPIEWEHRYGFNPLIWEDHENIDPDHDSINNYEEFLTYDLGSDPFCKDFFLELDFMETGPNGKTNIIPESSDEIIKDPYHRRNIIFHIDRGVGNGGDIIPYDGELNSEKLRQIFYEYFMNNDENNWRRGVFHYGVFVDVLFPSGFSFSGDVSPFMGYLPGTNCFAVSCREMEDRLCWYPLKEVDYIFASVTMHELGHHMGLRWGHPYGVDCRFGIMPWSIVYWIIRNYKSCMNYRYTYRILDYSDGSHGKRDFDDWENIDFSYFEYTENIVVKNTRILNRFL